MKETNRARNWTLTHVLLCAVAKPAQQTWKEKRFTWVNSCSERGQKAGQASINTKTQDGEEGQTETEETVREEAVCACVCLYCYTFNSLIYCGW